MTRIAYIPLTPLGDSILLMGELVELHRLYDPCEITVFAIPLIAELYSNFSFCDRVVTLAGGIHGKVTLERAPDETYDMVFNHGYEPWYDEIIRKIPHRRAYGMEELYRDAATCRKLFDEWVSLEHWENITKKKYTLVPQQMSELIRLVSPNYQGGPVRLTTDNYSVSMPDDMPDGKFILFLPGTSAGFKHYPTKKFLALAKLCRLSGFEPVFAVGPQDDSERAELSHTPYKTFVSLPLRKLAGLISRAALVIGNDSGPMHLAASFDVPTIHLFSFSGAQTWFCYDENQHRVIMPDCGTRMGLNCGECVRTCIGSIRIRDIVSVMESLLRHRFEPLRRVAYFAQDHIGDVLVWANQIEALFDFYAPCEVLAFTPSRLASECLSGFVYCDRVITYDQSVAWTEKQVSEYGHFDAVFNTRYDCDSLRRVVALSHDSAYGFENVEIPESDCRAHYDAYLPLSMWDDFHLRRECSVTAQGARLIKLVWPEYDCDHVELGESTYIHDFSRLSVPSAGRIVFVLGASDKGKHWGTEKFLDLAQAARKRGFESLFLLGPQETALSGQIETAGFHVALNLPFARIAALLSKGQRTACVVGNDTGVMHLAAMLGVPTVTLIPNGANFTWFPYGADGRARHVCCTPPCARPACSLRCPDVSTCVSKIRTEDVETAIQNLINVELKGDRPC